MFLVFHFFHLIYAIGNFLVSTSKDGSWSFLDVTRGKCLASVYGVSKSLPSENEVYDPYMCCNFHPDGLILGTGTSGSNALRVWDVREQNNVAVCAEHTDSITSLAFSENGYLVATGSQDSSVKIWDLRKLKCVKTIEGTSPVNAVAFDYSGAYTLLVFLFLAIRNKCQCSSKSKGSYLAVGSDNDVTVKVVKEWTDVAVRSNASLLIYISSFLSHPFCCCRRFRIIRSLQQVSVGDQMHLFWLLAPSIAQLKF